MAKKKKKGFVKAPFLSETERKNLERRILHPLKDDSLEGLKKTETKTLYIRIPAEYHDEIEKISHATNRSMNYICSEILIQWIKENAHKI